MQALRVGLYLAIFMLQPGTSAAQVKLGPTGTLQCERPASRLYATKSVDDALKLTLLAQFPIPKVNQQTQDIRGVVVVENESGKLEYSPILLKSRGNSRGSACEFPPLRMKFVDSETRKSIEAKLAQSGHEIGTSDYLREYYRNFLDATLDPAAQEKARGRGVFNKLGDDIKIVTHCGKAPDWPVIGGEDDVTQNTRLLSEYYLYKILERFETTVEFVRLAKITYVKPSGEAFYPGEAKLAFFREPPRSLADRCGLLAKKPANKVGIENPISKFQAEFLNVFVFNADFGLYGHNMNLLYDADGNSFFGPYDFDLSGIFVDGYFKNTTLTNNRDAMLTYIGANKDLASPMINKALSEKAEMQRIIDEATLPRPVKTRFQEWFTMYMNALAETHLGFEPR